MKTGEKIRYYRKQRGWTQKQLSLRCGGTILVSAISKYETGGISDIPASVLCLLSEALGVTIYDLLGDDIYKGPQKVKERPKEERGNENYIMSLQSENERLRKRIREKNARIASQQALLDERPEFDNGAVSLEHVYRCRARKMKSENERLKKENRELKEELRNGNNSN